MLVRGTVTVGWNPVADADLSGYRVYSGSASGNYSYGFRDAGLSGDGTTGVPKLILTGLEDQKTVYAAVTAYDTTGNESTFSAEVSKFVMLPLTTVRRTFR